MAETNSAGTNGTTPTLSKLARRARQLEALIVQDTDAGGWKEDPTAAPLADLREEMAGELAEALEQAADSQEAAPASRCSPTLTTAAADGSVALAGLDHPTPRGTGASPPAAAAEALRDLLDKLGRHPDATAIVQGVVADAHRQADELVHALGGRPEPRPTVG